MQDLEGSIKKWNIIFINISVELSVTLNRCSWKIKINALYLRRAQRRTRKVFEIAVTFFTSGSVNPEGSEEGWLKEERRRKEDKEEEETGGIRVCCCWLIIVRGIRGIKHLGTRGSRETDISLLYNSLSVVCQCWVKAKPFPKAQMHVSD